MTMSTTNNQLKFKL